MLPPPFENALVLTGPTASGKSALALELAERLNGEIISMDSMTLYRGMDIGTAKPSVEERQRVPHHLIDVLDPWESANVAWWLQEAGRVCGEIESRGRQPLFVGGTPFYLKALMFGLFDSPPADQELRRKLEREAEEFGPDKLHERLAKVDPASSARLHPNDVRRVVRALEVFELTGRPLSDWQQQNWWGGESGAKVAEAEGQLPQVLAIDIDRQELYRRIDARVEKMIADGWIDEVRRLRELPRPLSREASQALGYRELGDFLDGKMPLPDAVALIQMRSRQFAKRQLTWFRNLKGVRLVEGKLTIDLWHRTMS